MAMSEECSAFGISNIQDKDCILILKLLHWNSQMYNAPKPPIERSAN